MTQIKNAKLGKTTPDIRAVSQIEEYPLNNLKTNIASGKTVILKNTKHDCHPVGIGKDLTVKVNANLGTSKPCANVELEMKKMEAAIQAGADTIMDLSTGGDIDAIRQQILDTSQVPVGTVPIYQVMTTKQKASDVTEDDFIRSIEKHVEDGVDFITVHCGIRRDVIPALRSRTMGVVSRGGSFLVNWMLHHKKENPLFTYFDDICLIAKKYDVVLSLGDGFRPGCLADATDTAQIEELKTLGELAQRALAKDVQVIIEGPGHVPLQDIQRNVELQKKYCHGAPFYILGPLVTDVAAGYDHIAGAIGGAIAGMHGADFLCYLTPTEHLGLPNLDHVIEGVHATKIAAHAADIARGNTRALARNIKMSQARAALDWEGMFALSLDPVRARKIRREQTGKDEIDTCTMCGELCSAKLNREMKICY